MEELVKTLLWMSLAGSTMSLVLFAAGRLGRKVRLALRVEQRQVQPHVCAEPRGEADVVFRVEGQLVAVQRAVS